MLMFIANSLNLSIYDAELHKDPFLNFCYFCCISTLCHTQAVDCVLRLYADDTCLLFQYKGLRQTKEELTKNFSSVCYSFLDNKLSIYFGEDKTKSLFFSTKNGKRKIRTFEIQCGVVEIKQYSKVTYLGSELDESLSGEAMTLKVINKISGRFKFIYKKNRYIT